MLLVGLCWSSQIMALGKVPVTMCSSLISQNLSASEEVMCSKCW
jgi:hypothetical protein